MRGFWRRISSYSVAASRADEKLPVMVWIPGGAWVMGTTADPTLDGTKLAKKGVVLVTVAYRLGAFGFLAHPQLSSESGKGSGNYGIQDQIAALKWVQANIGQFGGDPAQVTAFGESAGAISVSILAAAPPAKGLFQRVIAESGASMAAYRRGDDADTAEGSRPIRMLKTAEALGEKFLANLGAKDIAAARGASAAAILNASNNWSPAAVADGEIIVGDPYELYQAGRFADLPVLCGLNSDDGGYYTTYYTGTVKADLFEKNVRYSFGPTAEAVLAKYPHASDAEATQSTREMVRDLAFGWPAWAWASQQTKVGKNKAWVYYMEHLPSSPTTGVAHAAEVPYVFGNLGGAMNWTAPEDFPVSDKISTYWVNFAKTGDPNGPGLPVWPAFDEKSNATMIFDTVIEAKAFPNLATIRTLDAYFAWLRTRAKEK
jgi:para-nitrobenzyl esterase